MYKLPYNMSIEKFQAIQKTLYLLLSVLRYQVLLKILLARCEDGKRRSQNYPRQNGGKVIFKTTFHSTDVFCTLSRLFVRLGLDRFFGSLETSQLIYCKIASLNSDCRSFSNLRTVTGSRPKEI